ncbi:MAG: exo-beta-N-acetylmuramidase NamZ domain-containing protein [Caldimicrobium sp.]
MKRNDLKLGVEVFFEKECYSKKFKKAKIALLTHQAAVDKNLVLTYELFYKEFGDRLLYLFSPQHGLFSEKQANMDFSSDEIEPLFGLEVKSLYGERLAPERHDLEKVDVIFVDLVDVGCRVYTYIWTLFLTMKSCDEFRKEIVVCDRLNPLGRTLEGPILEKEFYSFVGLDSLPMRHGLTIGEVAKLFQKRHFPNLSLEVIPMENYNPYAMFPAFGSFWVPPSPNLPTFSTALVYPGMVLFEGTNLSEGRGTTLPFLTFGAPYLNFKKMAEFLKEHFPEEAWGIKFKPTAFIPTFDKWKGEKCLGFQIFITNPILFKPVTFALKLMKFLYEECPSFEFLKIPYEFERVKRPIDILLGRKKILHWLEEGEEEDIDGLLSEGLEEFRREIEAIIIYN